MFGEGLLAAISQRHVIITALIVQVMAITACEMPTKLGNVPIEAPQLYKMTPAMLTGGLINQDRPCYFKGAVQPAPFDSPQNLLLFLVGLSTKWQCLAQDWLASVRVVDTAIGEYILPPRAFAPFKVLVTKDNYSSVNYIWYDAEDAEIGRLRRLSNTSFSLSLRRKILAPDALLALRIDTERNETGTHWVAYYKLGTNHASKPDSKATAWAAVSFNQSEQLIRLKARLEPKIIFDPDYRSQFGQETPAAKMINALVNADAGTMAIRQLVLSGEQTFLISNLTEFFRITEENTYAYDVNGAQTYHQQERLGVLYMGSFLAKLKQPILCGATASCPNLPAVISAATPNNELLAELKKFDRSDYLSTLCPGLIECDFEQLFTAQ